MALNSGDKRDEHMSVHTKIARKISQFPVLVLPILWVLFSVLLVVVNVIPDSWVNRAITDGIQEVTKEGDHPWVFFTPQSQLDNFTDKIMLQLSQRTSPWNEVTKTFTEESEWNSLCNGAKNNPLYAAFANQGYSRYWHGYTVILKPLLTVFSYSAIRVISATILLILLCLAFGKIHKLMGLPAAMVFALFLAAINIYVVPLSLTFSPVFYIALICVCCLDIAFKPHSRILYFLIIGACTAYFDLLTVPFLTLCVPLAFLVLHDAQSPEVSIPQEWKMMFRSGVDWVLGYGLTWSLKWVLSSIILKNTLADAIHSILIRSDSGGVNEANGLSFNKLQTITMNYKYMLSGISKRYLFMVLIFVVLVCIYRLIAMKEVRGKFKTNIIRSLPLAVLVFTPVLWYLALSNHSSIHMQFFAYKNVGISILCGMLFMVSVFGATESIKDH